MKLVKNANYQGNACSNSIFVAAKPAVPLNWCRNRGVELHVIVGLVNLDRVDTNLRARSPSMVLNSLPSRNQMSNMQNSWVLHTTTDEFSTSNSHRWSELKKKKTPKLVYPIPCSVTQLGENSLISKIVWFLDNVWVLRAHTTTDEFSTSNSHRWSELKKKKTPMLAYPIHWSAWK